MLMLSEFWRTLNLDSVITKKIITSRLRRAFCGLVGLQTAVLHIVNERMKTRSQVWRCQFPPCPTNKLYLVAACKNVIADLPNSTTTTREQKNSIVSDNINWANGLRKVVPSDKISAQATVSKTLRICVSRKINIVELLFELSQFPERIRGCNNMFQGFHSMHHGNRLYLTDLNVAHVLASTKDKQCFHEIYNGLTPAFTLKMARVCAGHFVGVEGLVGAVFTAFLSAANFVSACILVSLS